MPDDNRSRLFSFKDDAWFSGFAAGEGCFLLQKHSQACGTDRITPAFHLKLRSDDGEILARLRDEFGGSLHEENRDRDGSNPQLSWHVSSKRDLKLLIDYFDRFPLRARKANDYLIWRRAVNLYCQRGGGATGGALRNLRRLKGQLEGARRFEQSAYEEPGPEPLPLFPRL